MTASLENVFDDSRDLFPIHHKDDPIKDVEPSKEEVENRPSR
jgi:hypothetical protein